MRSIKLPPPLRGRVGVGGASEDRSRATEKLRGLSRIAAIVPTRIDTLPTFITLAAMTQELAIALAQINPTVGDVEGNLARIRRARAQAAAQKADLVVFSELVLCGYPPEDLVLKPAFQAACRAAVLRLAEETADGGPAVLVGSPWLDDGKLYNAALLLADG